MKKCMRRNHEYILARNDEVCDVFGVLWRSVQCQLQTGFETQDTLLEFSKPLCFFAWCFSFFHVSPNIYLAEQTTSAAVLS